MYVSDHPKLNSDVCKIIDNILRQKSLLKSNKYYLTWRYKIFENKTYIALVLYVKYTWNTFKNIGIKRTKFFKDFIPDCIIDTQSILLTEEIFNRLCMSLKVQGYELEI